MNVGDAVGGLVFAIRNPEELRKYLKTRSSASRQLAYSLARLGIPINENERLLRSLKGRHEGQRCFVIGNGPSLRLEDLERLKGEVTIASNRIYVAFPELSWRPTYFTCMDTIYAENYGAELDALEVFKLFPDHFRPYLAQSGSSGRRGTTAFFRQLSGHFDFNGAYRGAFSSNVLRGIHTGPTVTIVNLQLASYMGCRPIYLLGVDGCYTLSPKVAAHSIHGQVVVCEGEQNHFHPTYRVPGETYVAPLPEEIETAYRTCREFLKGRGVRVLNASRRTCITAFDTIDADRVLT